MLDGKASVTYLLSAAALLGPVSYILFAFYELGRLNYFGAPTDFLQISSFGILPVVTTVYPGVFFTFMVGGFVSGARFAKGNNRLFLVVSACAYLSAVFYFISLTVLWRSVFAIVASVALLSTILIERHKPVIGNQEPDPDKKPQSDEMKHDLAMNRIILVLMGAGVFVFFFSAAGKKIAVIQEQYWVFGNEVVLGFYGDLALVAERNDSEIGPKFRVEELKSVKDGMLLQRIGPLTPAPMWKKKEFRTLPEKLVDGPGSLL